MPNWGQGLQGATGGAMGGAAIGGPIGGVIGGAVGGLAGLLGGSGPQKRDYMLPGFDERQRRLNEAISGAGGVGAPTAQAAQIGPMGQAGMGGEFRGGQQQLIGQLQQQAMGQGPSLAQMQFDRNLDQGIAAQIAAARSGVGNASAANRGAAQNIGGLTQDLAGQAAQARMQEQLMARQQLAGVLGTARGQEMQGSQFNVGQQNQGTLAQAGFDQQTSLANQDAYLRNQQLQNQYGLGLRELELQNAMQQRQGLAGFSGGQQNMTGTQFLSGGAGALTQAIGQGRFS